MLSPVKFVLISSSSQPSRLGGGLVPSDNNVGSVRGGLPPTVAHQGEEVDTDEIAIEQQKRSKQICDADREKYRQFYDDELRRKRPQQFLYRERPRGGESDKVAQEKLRASQGQRVKHNQLQEGTRLAKQRAWQEQREKDDRLRERRRLARQRAWKEQRDKDEQLLESHRLALRLHKQVWEDCIRTHVPPVEVVEVAGWSFWFLTPERQPSYKAEAYTIAYLRLLLTCIYMQAVSFYNLSLYRSPPT